jgi:hypothetical protein
MEIWKEIEGFDGIYAVSNYGNIKNIKRNRLLVLKGNKYKDVLLSKNNTQTKFYVHRLVGLAFIPNPLNKPTINHKNGIGTCNNVDNLEWATYSENNKHALDTGLRGVKPRKKYKSKYHP